MQEICFSIFCLIPASTGGDQKIFGFAEYISALTLLVLIYTLTDVRHKFRLAIAPLPLYKLSFVVIGSIGAISLLGEVWIAKSWWVLKIPGYSMAVWQASLGLVFLCTFIAWIWYAYMRPSKFGPKNAARYAREMYHHILTGNESNLAVIADELKSSSEELCKYAPSIPRHYRTPDEPARARSKFSEVEVCAHNILELLANRNFCRQIVRTSPATAIYLMEDAAKLKKYHLPLGLFANNITIEALRYEQSLLYMETEQFTAGLLGNMQPFRKAMYGDWRLVEGLGNACLTSPLDISFGAVLDWTGEELTVYGKAIITTMTSWLRETQGRQHSSALDRAINFMEGQLSGAYRINIANSSLYDSPEYARFNAVVDFAKDAVNAIGEMDPLPPVPRLKVKQDEYPHNIYDTLANLMFEIIFTASTIEGDQDRLWYRQYGAVWNSFFGYAKKNKAWNIVRFKLRRLLYNEIRTLDSMPNAKNARILGICLNVCGLSGKTIAHHARDYGSLAAVVIPYAKRIYPELLAKHRKVAKLVLVGSISYDEAEHKLVKTYADVVVREAPAQEFLELDPRPLPTRLKPGGSLLNDAKRINESH